MPCACSPFSPRTQRRKKSWKCGSLTPPSAAPAASFAPHLPRVEARTGSGYAFAVAVVPARAETLSRLSCETCVSSSIFCIRASDHLACVCRGPEYIEAQWRKPLAGCWILEGLAPALAAPGRPRLQEEQSLRQVHGAGGPLLALGWSNQVHLAPRQLFACDLHKLPYAFGLPADEDGLRVGRRHIPKLSSRARACPC